LPVRFLDFQSDSKICRMHLTEAYVKSRKRFETTVKEECKHFCVSTFLDSIIMHSITIGTIYCNIYICIYKLMMSHYNISVKRMASFHILTCVMHSFLESYMDFEPFSAGTFSLIIYPQCRRSHVWCQMLGNRENLKISLKFPFCSYNLDFI
jgi:hypothetical protein